VVHLNGKMPEWKWVSLESCGRGKTRKSSILFFSAIFIFYIISLYL
jgi:hypothetical protein